MDGEVLFRNDHYQSFGRMSSKRNISEATRVWPQFEQPTDLFDHVPAPICNSVLGGARSLAKFDLPTAPFSLAASPKSAVPKKQCCASLSDYNSQPLLFC